MVPTFLLRIAYINKSSRHVKSWVNYPVYTHLVRESGRQFSRDGILVQKKGQNRIRRGEISLHTVLQPCERCLALQLRIAENSTSSERQLQKRPKKTLFFLHRNCGCGKLWSCGFLCPKEHARNFLWTEARARRHKTERSKSHALPRHFFI